MTTSNSIDSWVRRRHLELGVSVPPDRHAAQFAARAEVVGFDYLTSGEHVVFHGPSSNAFIALAAAAGATRRVRLLTAVTLLPLYPAVLAAKQAAVLDVVSGGRLELGVGIGGEFPKEFEACGVPVGERAARTEESLEVITELLTGRRLSYQGRFNSFRGVAIRPRPVQRPRPPLWIAGRREGAMRRAVRFGDGWLPYLYTPEQLRRSIHTIQRIAEEGGRSRELRMGLVSFLTVYSDGNKARREAADRVSRTYQQDFSDKVDRYLIAGTPNECRTRIETYAEAGADAIFVTLACPASEAESMARRLGEEVMPGLPGRLWEPESRGAVVGGPRTDSLPVPRTFGAGSGEQAASSEAGRPSRRRGLSSRSESRGHQ